MKVITSATSSSVSTRTFEFVGTSLVAGTWKVRLGNDIQQRLKIQAANGFKHPSYVQLDEPMNALDAVKSLLGFADYFSDDYAAERKGALVAYLQKRGVDWKDPEPEQEGTEEVATDATEVTSTDTQEPAVDTVEPTEPAAPAPKSGRKGRK